MALGFTSSATQTGKKTGNVRAFREADSMKQPRITSRPRRINGQTFLTFQILWVDLGLYNIFQLKIERRWPHCKHHRSTPKWRGHRQIIGYDDKMTGCTDIVNEFFFSTTGETGITGLGRLRSSHRDTLPLPDRDIPTPSLRNRIQPDGYWQPYASDRQIEMPFI